MTVRSVGEERILLAFSAAPAFAMAKLTPSIAFAPSLLLFSVPSSLLSRASTADWSLTSTFSFITAGPMTSTTLETALLTPLPPHLDLSPSRSSCASCCPVGAQPDASRGRSVPNVRTSGSTRRDNGSVQAHFRNDIYLDGRIATGIVDGSRVYLCYRHLLGLRSANRAGSKHRGRLYCSQMLQRLAIGDIAPVETLVSYLEFMQASLF